MRRIRRYITVKIIAVCLILSTLVVIFESYAISIVTSMDRRCEKAESLVVTSQNDHVFLVDLGVAKGAKTIRWANVPAELYFDNKGQMRTPFNGESDSLNARGRLQFCLEYPWSRLCTSDEGELLNPYMCVERGFGWPFVAMRVWYRDEEMLLAIVSRLRNRTTLVDFNRQVWKDGVLEGIYIGAHGPSWKNSIIIPYKIVWAGLIANIIIFSGIIWSVFTLFGSTKRIYRKRRSLCQACAYPLRANTMRCSECGTEN